MRSGPAAALCAFSCPCFRMASRVLAVRTSARLTGSPVGPEAKRTSTMPGSTAAPGRRATPTSCCGGSARDRGGSEVYTGRRALVGAAGRSERPAWRRPELPPNRGSRRHRPRPRAAFDRHEDRLGMSAHCRAPLTGSRSMRTVSGLVPTAVEACRQSRRQRLPRLSVRTRPSGSSSSRMWAVPARQPPRDKLPSTRTRGLASIFRT
jgi:hypothetical protein